MKLIPRFFTLSASILVVVASAASGFGGGGGSNSTSEATTTTLDSLDWIARYSMKFQGCSDTNRHWNTEATTHNDVRLKTKRLVHFHLCPKGTCSDSSAHACSGESEGKYIVDIETYLTAYLKHEAAALLQNDNDMMLQYASCRPAKHINNNNNAHQDYYIGPYCADQGASIRVGLFTDNTCSIFADHNQSSGGQMVYFDLGTQEELAFNETSLVVDQDCLSCQQEDNNNKTRKLGWYDDEIKKITKRHEEGSQDDAAKVNEMCENLYKAAGKCEKNMLPHHGKEEDNNKTRKLGWYAAENKKEEDYETLDTSACDYMSSIKIVRWEGIITTESDSPSLVTIAIFFLAIVFLALVVRVYQLRKIVYADNTLDAHYQNNGYDVIPAAEIEAFL